MTVDEQAELIRDNNNWMQGATGPDREEDPYLVIQGVFNEDEMPIGMVMYLKSERKDNIAIYAAHEDNEIEFSALMRYSPMYATCFRFIPSELLTNLPEIIRDRKIVCYDNKRSAAILREYLAEHGDRFEITGPVVDIKEEARKTLGLLPDYRLDTLVRVCGYDKYDYALDALGTMMKVRDVYEAIKAIKEISDTTIIRD